MVVDPPDQKGTTMMDQTTSTPTPATGSSPRPRFATRSRKALVALTAAGALTLGGAGAAFAADAPPTGPNGMPPAAGHEGPGGVRLRAAHISFQAAAEALGMSPEELRAQVKDGPQSIAQVAGDQTGAVVEAIVAALTARVHEAVANGTVPAERAEKVVQRLPEMADRFVNRVPGQHTS
ncbi:MAG: hypothetical protein AMXMBFR46_22030 [Acidimicrobiia bacterium]